MNSSPAALVAAAAFAEALGVTPQAARAAFRDATAGKSWRGENLPVVEVQRQRGGASGKVWALALDRASPELRALLKLPDTLPSMPVEPRLKGRPDARQIAVAVDRLRVIAPIVAHPKGSRERAAAFRAATGQPHRVGAGWSRFKERTLRDWVRSAETGGGDALMPVARSDKGKRRVRITRRWQNGCGLPGEVQDCIADKLERIARGLILKGRSDRETQRLAATELQRLSVEAGVKLPKKQLAALCRLNCACVRRFDEMKAARDYSADHKRYSDSHEYRVQRTLTRASMEVLMGDVHRIDLSVADAVQSRDPRIHLAANEAEKTGRKTLRVAIIGWMDGSSHYFWATPVILGPGQGITQLDVARSLHGVVTCPWGGIPREIVIDNGGEYGALAEAVALRRRSRGASLHL